MNNIQINNNYTVLIENDFNNLHLFLSKYNYIVIITDDNIANLYLNTISDMIGTKLYGTYSISNGEKSKNLSTIEDIYKFLMRIGAKRDYLILALGGGVVGDIAGFVASTYLRGIDFIQIPTTLLSQVDSSVGGKVGVDFLDKKNMIGSFYNPILVYVNISTLKTLPKEQFFSGMAEVIKHGYILDSEYLSFIEENIFNIKNLDENVLKEMIYKSIKIKNTIVTQDERENNIRQILNFGHTFAHALETYKDFNILHGEAVFFGMLCSLNISFCRGYLNEDEFMKSKKLILAFSLYNYNENLKDINIDEIFSIMHFDKKIKNDKINFIVLNKIGNAIIKSDITKDEIYSSIYKALHNYILED